MAKEMVLLYNIDKEKERKIKSVLLLMKVRAKSVTPELFCEKIGVLTGVIPQEDVQSDNIEKKISDFTDEMLVMSGFSNARIDTFLQMMRKKKIEKVALKAIVTPHNYQWNAYELHEELAKEHEKMNGSGE